MGRTSSTVVKNDSNTLLSNGIQSIAPFVLFICCAAILKLFYSHATPVELLWMLKPTALSVKFFTGIHFVFDMFEGYCSIDKKIIIAPACAGVNFMIVLICVIALLICKYRHIQSVQQFIWYLTAIIVISYCTTLICNTIRIMIAIACYDKSIHWAFFTQERIHRLIGIVIYFAGICIAYLLTGKVLNKTENFPKNHKEKYSLYVIPLIWYITIMVVIPLIRGKQIHKYQLFIEHVTFTTAIPFMIILLFVLLNKLVKHRRINI
jgi:exosortase K